MEINKKKREDLKDYFLTNKIPTEENFGELIDAGLNQADDGIAKAPGHPIALQAEGEAGEVLHLFSSFEEEGPDWAVDLSPRLDPETGRDGLNFRDGTGASRLFISSSGGKVGIGTIEPSSRLTVQGSEDGSMLSVSRTAGGPGIFEVMQEESSGALSVRAGDGTVVSRLSGSKDKPGFFLSKVGIGTADPQAKLAIGSGTNEDLLLLNSECPWKFTSAGSGSSTALLLQSIVDKKYFHVASPDGMAVLSVYTAEGGGKVGIGTTSPAARLDVNGGLTVRGPLKTLQQHVVAFSAYVAATFKGEIDPLPMTAVTTNMGDAYDPGTSTFTAPVKGVYLFTMTIIQNNNASHVYWYLRLNTTDYLYNDDSKSICLTNGERASHSRTFITHLNAGDRVSVQQKCPGDMFPEPGHSGLEGVLLYALED